MPQTLWSNYILLFTKISNATCYDNEDMRTMVSPMKFIKCQDMKINSIEAKEVKIPNNNNKGLIL